MPQADQKSNRQERRRREVHRRILDAAVELFDARGVANTRIDDICEFADLAQKTFFNHFSTKQHLFREITYSFIQNVCALVEEGRKEQGSTGERLAYVFRRAGEEAHRRGPHHRELLQEAARLGAAEEIDPAQSRSLPQAFRALLADGIAAGDVTRLQSLPFLTETVVSVFQGVFKNWAHDEHYALDLHLEEAARFLSRAIVCDEATNPQHRIEKLPPAAGGLED
ncbi:MAG: TetR/AcrR family transcriptional regulator [Deltaproteobacteria bacterium]|nr:TetR/AcrR family transcriptional regulator [Deltaproteobacteria bacterium]